MQSQAVQSTFRVVPLSMGKVLGGGSSINVMAWARGHKSDWDFFAEEAGDPAWGYESVRFIIASRTGTASPTRNIEDGGPAFVEPAPDPNSIAPAMVEGAFSVGILTFENQNGRMMESDGDCLVRASQEVVCRWAPSTRRRCSCNPVSAMRPNSDASGFPLS